MDKNKSKTVDKAKVTVSLESIDKEELRKAVVDIVIAELRANGPLRMALMGLFPPESKQEQPPSA